MKSRQSHNIPELGGLKLALINCPECNKEISDKAPACPNCGNPMKDTESEPVSQQELLHCPKCDSTNLKTNDKGFSLGKAAVGGVLLGGVGLLAGMHGSKRIRVNCMQCGHSWVPLDEARKAEKEAARLEKKRKNREVMTSPLAIVMYALLAGFVALIFFTSK